MLKTIRLSLAIIISSLLLLFFVDYLQLLPLGIHRLAHFQLFPAFLFDTKIFILTILLTFFFGRIYCSILCPLGVMQDFIFWLHKKNNKKFRLFFSKPHPFLRYISLGIMIIALFSGFTFIVGLLEPYSIFGRIATHLYKPIVLFINNIFTCFFE